MDLPKVKTEEVEIKTEPTEAYFVDIADLIGEVPKQELLHDEVEIKEEDDEAVSTERALMEEVNIKEEFDEPIRKRRKKSGDVSDQDNVEDSALSESKENSSAPQVTTRDEHSIFGEYVANKVRACDRPKEEVSLAQRYINNVLSRLNMGQLAAEIPSIQASHTLSPSFSLIVSHSPSSHVSQDS